MGYDIVRCNGEHNTFPTNPSQSDYKDIDPRYGTLDDVDKLISEMKKRDMKLMMDLVVNHTSIEVSYPLMERRSSFSGDL